MTVLFDRLAYMDRLTAGGVTEGQARLHADALDLALREAVVTRSDLDEAVQALRHEFHDAIGALRSDLEHRFQAIDDRFQAIDDHFQAIDDRFQKIDERFQSVDKRFQGIDRRLDGLDHRMDGLERRLEELEARIDMKLAALEQRMTIRLGAMMAVSLGILSVLITVF